MLPNNKATTASHVTTARHLVNKINAARHVMNAQKLDDKWYGNSEMTDMAQDTSLVVFWVVGGGFFVILLQLLTTYVGYFIWKYEHQPPTYEDKPPTICVPTAATTAMSTSWEGTCRGDGGLGKDTTSTRWGTQQVDGWALDVVSWSMEPKIRHLTCLGPLVCFFISFHPYILY